MKIAQILIGIVLIIAAASAANCTQLILEGDHYRQVEQYQEITVKLVAYTDCATESHSVTSFTDLPVKLSSNEFSLGTGARAIYATISPGAADPGLYTVHFLMDSTQDISREEFVVKVIETNNPLLIAEAPALMNIPEHQDFDVAIAVTNKGETILNNVVAFIDEEGEERYYAEELSDLKPGKTRYINFHFDPRPRGEYTFNYTVASGSYEFKGQTVVGSSSKNYPISSIATIRNHDEGYIVNYLVKNIGPKGVTDLFLTVEDAPSDWQVISPSVFNLGAGQTKEVELVLLYGEKTDSDIHLALYEGDALLAEDSLIISQARLSGTGLISFADSFELGLLLLLIIGIAYFGYNLHKKSNKKNIDVRTLIPNWLEDFWPF